MLGSLGSTATSPAGDVGGRTSTDQVAPASPVLENMDPRPYAIRGSDGASARAVTVAAFNPSFRGLHDPPSSLEQKTPAPLAPAQICPPPASRKTSVSKGTPG